MYGPFDTLEAAETPARAGLPGPRAKAIAIAMRKAAGENVATGADIAEAKAELAAVKWVLGFMAGLLLAIAARVYGAV